MVIIEKPYFMTNEEWYFYNEETFRYELTEKAPQKAIDSYNDYYKELDKEYEEDTEK